MSVKTFTNSGLLPFYKLIKCREGEIEEMKSKGKWDEIKECKYKLKGALERRMMSFSLGLEDNLRMHKTK